ncbi:MAG TPA: hypothetical protein VF720_06830 [Candidatus Eisenbacteria bacterium]
MNLRRPLGLSAMIVVGTLIRMSEAEAQGIRGEYQVSASAIEYLSVVRDSFPESEVPGSGTTRVLPDGTVVECVPGGYCYRYRAGELRTASPVTEDLSLTAWPGWRGIQARAHVRGRFGSNDLWPRSSEKLALLDLTVEMDRTDWRLRAGRQQHLGGLGAMHFDGGSLLWKGVPAVRVTAFAGRSLGRGLFAPYTGSLLAESDELPPLREAVVVGVEGRYRPNATLAASLLYQVEIRTDRASLYSERVALDATWQPQLLRLELSGDADLASLVVNDLKLRLGRTFGTHLDLTVEGRHSEPFFELWTIWGAFTPVGFDQLRFSADYRIDRNLSLEGGIAWRDYAETHTGIQLAPIEGDGLRGRAGARWQQEAWSASVAAGLDQGYGAYRGQLDAAVEREFGPRTSLGLFAVGTQQFTEFRFGEGTTRGVGATARHGIGAVDLTGRVGYDRHTFENRPGYDDYGQWRGTIALSGRFGRDPAAPKPRDTPGWRP